MKTIRFAVLVSAVIALTSPGVAAGEKPADPPKKSEKKSDPKDVDRDAEKLKKEVDGYTGRLKGDAGKKLWDIVTKGNDDELKATGLKPEVIETLKTERPNLKGWQEILTNEKLGKQVLKDLTDYGASSKFTKTLDDEAKAREKKDKEREREIKQLRKEREKNREKEK